MIAPAIALVSLLLLACGVALDPSAGAGLHPADRAAVRARGRADRIAARPRTRSAGCSWRSAFRRDRLRGLLLRIPHPGHASGIAAGRRFGGVDRRAPLASGFGLLVFALLLFPNGHLLSRRWRWVAAVALVDYAGMAVAGIFDSSYTAPNSVCPRSRCSPAPWTRSVRPIFNRLLVFNLVMLVVAGISLVFRLRRSHGEERQQVKWFIYAVAFVDVRVPDAAVRHAARPTASSCSR